MVTDEAKTPNKEKNLLSDIVPIFIYGMPCACLTADDVRLLMKLKILYENYAVLFCLSSIYCCPYADLCERKPPEVGTERKMLIDSRTSPGCSSSQRISSTPPSLKSNGSDMSVVSLNSLPNVIAPDHCDVNMRRTPYTAIENFSTSLPQDSKHTDCKLSLRSSRKLTKKCVSKPEQLQCALEEIGFIFHQLPSIKLKESSTEQNRQNVDKDKQPKSLVYLLEDRSRTLRISIQTFLKKVLQFHITKAAKVLNRYRLFQ